MPTNRSVANHLQEADKDDLKVLGLSINGKTIENGAFVTKAQAKSAPTLSFTIPPTTVGPKYIAIAVDLTAPFVNFNVLGPILHWIQPDLTLASDDQTLASTSPPLAEYIGPAPPPGSAAHKYAFFLYEQPPEMDLERVRLAPLALRGDVGTSKRMRFNLDAFEIKAGLKRRFVASGWFMSK